MVNPSTIAALAVQALLGIAICLFLLIYGKRKLQISYRAVAVGALIFVVFSQILEQLLHGYLLSGNPVTAAWLKNPWLMAVYGALAAAVFENVGRWLGFSLLLKKRRERKDGIALGIGHGGVEIIIVSVITSIMGIMMAASINAGDFQSALGTAPSPEQAAVLEGLKAHLIETPSLEYWLGAFERIPAVALHISLSLVVLYGIRTRKAIYLLYAIGFHAFVDFFAALYQTKALPFWAVESIVWLCGIAAAFVIVKSKAWFAALPPAAAENKV